MKRYVIERDIPGVGHKADPDYVGISQTSNAALAQLAPRVQWEHSYVAGDQTFCVYLAESEDDIRRHTELSGFPANRITPINRIIDPVTGGLSKALGI
jgi:hypothetical protein